MGFTQYKSDQRAFTDAEWERFLKSAKSILVANANIVAGPMGDRGTHPVINNEMVSFNGVEDESHETCVTTKKARDFEFCKTAEKDYDKVVVQIWKAARHVLGEDGVKLSSDGGEEIFG